MSPRWEPNPDIRRGRSVVYILHAHLVFTPKYRRGPFTDEILRRCEEVMRDVCTDFGAELREFNGERDHVHLLVHYPPKSPSPDSLAPSRASPLGGCASATGCAPTGRTCGRRHTSRPRLVAHRWRPSGRTSASSAPLAGLTPP